MAAAWGARRRAPAAEMLLCGAGGRPKSFCAKSFLFLAVAVSTVLAPRPLCVCAAGADAAWFFLPAGPDPRPEIAALPPDLDRAGWREVQLPHAFDPIQPQNGVFGWYACAFHVPKFLEGTDLVLDLGVIDDADATYLNGVKVGETGSFSDKRRSAWNQDRRYRAPASAVRVGEANALAVQAKDFGGIGGFLGRPYIGAALAPPARAPPSAGLRRTPSRRTRARRSPEREPCEGFVVLREVVRECSGAEPREGSVALRKVLDALAAM